MTILTNNINLSARLDRDKESGGGFVDIPVGSKIIFSNMSSGLHAYYEIHTYSLNCIFDGKSIIISCSKYVGGREPKVDCIKDNMFKRKVYYWSEVFNEEFPG